MNFEFVVSELVVGYGEKNKDLETSFKRSIKRHLKRKEKQVGIGILFTFAIKQKKN